MAGLVLTHGCAKPEDAVLMGVSLIPFGVFIRKKVTVYFSRDHTLQLPHLMVWEDFFLK